MRLGRQNIMDRPSINIIPTLNISIKIWLNSSVCLWVWKTKSSKIKLDFLFSKIVKIYSSLLDFFFFRFSLSCLDAKKQKHGQNQILWHCHILDIVDMQLQLNVLETLGNERQKSPSKANNKDSGNKKTVSSIIETVRL